jgi:hypothetical protein
VVLLSSRFEDSLYTNSQGSGEVVAEGGGIHGAPEVVVLGDGGGSKGADGGGVGVGVGRVVGDDAAYGYDVAGADAD